MKEIILLLNDALRLELAAAVQYLNHAAILRGLISPAIIALLEHTAADELAHAAKLRELITDYLGGVPAYDMAAAKPAQEVGEIIATNLAAEAEAIALYKKAHARVVELKAELAPVYEKVEHDLRHLIMDEQEHVAELSRLL